MEKMANRGNLRLPLLWLIMIIELLLLFNHSVSSAQIPTSEPSKVGDSNLQEVRLQINDQIVVIDNGLVLVTIENPSGFLIGIKYKGLDNVLQSRNKNSNKGYWDIVWDKGVDKIVTQHVEVITQTDDLVELSFTKTWNFTTDNGYTVPLNIDKRFIIRRGAPGLYMYGIFERQIDFPDADMSHIRIAFKLNTNKFRYMVLSDTRQRIMPSEGGQPLAYKEAILLTNPFDSQLRGEVEDKYQYSTENKDNKLHGWISDDDAVGFWIITPSDEFRIGGPHKQGLTSHPISTALSMFVTTHYAGRDINTGYKKGEYWKKVFGPLFIYLNSASTDAAAEDHHQALWNDAKRQLSEEIESWPYNFTRSEDFPHAEQRGEVSGQLLVRDRFIRRELVRAQSAFVGLAPPGDAGSWQFNGKDYQFWTQTDNNGCFNIRNVRPGLYNLYAWVHGFIGDYKLDLSITIQPGNKTNMGILIYDPPRNGPTLWEIGIPDRTAVEFFIPDPYPTYVNSLCLNDADKYRQYGLWERYSDIYRDGDLVFTLGVSNYSRDWFYAHVPRHIGYATLWPTTWQIKFNLENVNERGTYTLQLALAAASYAHLQVRINNPNGIRPYFTTKRIGYDNAVARHGIHGLYRLYSISVGGNSLKKGENTIFLTQIKSDSSYSAVMYDYIRLEGPSA